MTVPIVPPEVQKEQIKEQKQNQDKPKKKFDKRYDDRKPGLMDFYVGKDVRVHIRGYIESIALEGRLEKFTQYELLLTINQLPVLVMKHSVDFIELKT